MNIEIPTILKPVVTFAHPTLMILTLGLALYAGYLGLQVRKIRTAKVEEKKALQDEAGGSLKAIKDKHYLTGSLLLVGIVMGSIGGMAVTYINNGKLFVGAHLLAGLGVAGLAALSASLAPLMQQGKDWARYTHISINTLLVGIFAWQALTGFEIVQKILSQMAKAA
jgi:MFS family permease